MSLGLEMKFEPLSWIRGGVGKTDMCMSSIYLPICLITALKEDEARCREASGLMGIREHHRE